MARSAPGSLCDRQTGRGPLSRLAGTRARTLAALVYAASEATPAARAPSLLQLENLPCCPSNPTRRKILRYDKKLYRQRYLIEVFFHTLKSFRRIATRYEKTARNYLAIVHFACAMHWLNQAA
jgi:transposase